MLKKIFVLCFLFFMSQMFVYSFSEDELSNIEYYKYGKSYNTDSISSRLNRLETDYFGMAQNGDLNSRLDMLSKMAGNSQNSAFLSPEDSFYPGKKKSAIRNFIDNVSSTFADTGTITGFTPSMSTGYGYSNNIYGNEFRNFMNNYNQYCPYHNRHNNYINRPFNFDRSVHHLGNNWNNPYWNRHRNNYNAFYNNNPFINSGNNIHNNHFHRYPHHHYNVHNPYNNMMYPYPRNYVRPTNLNSNITTRSSVHIIRD